MSRQLIPRRIINVNGIDLFHFDSQIGNGTILCLHGRWGRAETWVDFIQHYAGKYRVIAPDQRGHGLSSKPISKYTASEMAEDIIALLDSLGINQIILVGHSMGGYIAAYLAANYSNYIKAVAILDKSPAGPSEPNTQPLGSIPVIDPITKDWPLPFSSFKEAREWVRQEMDSELSYQYFMNSLTEEVEGYKMLYSAQAIAANIAYYQSWYELLPKIKCPTLVIRSSSHEAVNDLDYNKMQNEISDCMAFEISDPDHNVHLSKKDEFYGYFDQFLNKLHE